jgi:uncharacterized protein (TIGR02300 family)
MWQIAVNSPNDAKVGSMATKEDRGTKRTCQNGDCSARYYDLNRDPITCPICGAGYVIAHSPVPIPAAPPPEVKPARKAKKEEFANSEEAETEKDSEEEALAEVETDDSVDDDDDADETFLEEEEEDGGDVSKIIGPVDGKEET